jgi:hypothetical protein
VTDADDLWNWELQAREERQAQARAVNSAEIYSRMFGPEDDEIQAGEIAAFLSQAISRSGLDRPDPEVVLDLDDADALEELLAPGASKREEAEWQIHGLVKDGVIHLHPGSLNKWTILHELAHYIAPQASHGPIWCRIYVDLVSDAFGDEVGRIFCSQLLQDGAKVASSLE